jgi:ATP-dependent helicase HrpA
MSSQISLHRVQRKLAKVFLLDREPLRRRLVRLQQEFEKLAQEQADSASQPIGKVEDSALENWRQKLRELSDDCDASTEKVEQRRKSFPKITYDVNLPVSERGDELKKLIAENQVVVVCGETGSGKSTQLPKICLELGLGARGLIGHTQPRRLAARSIAQRVADELQTPLGQHVGYKVRFNDETSDRTLIKLMTDGILLAESQNDRFFNRSFFVKQSH